MAKNVLITGASSGIGAATALVLHEKGYRVWGTIRQLERVDNLSEALKQAVRFVSMDVTHEESVTRGIDQIMAEAGFVDVLINNAGYGTFGSIEETPISLVQNQLDTNYLGTLRVLKKIVPLMRKEGRGTIINVSSLAAHFVIPFQVQYSASKYAIRALTEGLRQELRPFGIRVFAVEPGDIKTKFNDMTAFAPNTESPYEPWLTATWKTIDANMQIAPPPDVVAKTILKSIEKGRRSRQRFVTGDFVSCQFPWISRFLPDCTREWMIRLFYKVDG